MPRDLDVMLKLRIEYEILPRGSGVMDRGLRAFVAYRFSCPVCPDSWAECGITLEYLGVMEWYDIFVAYRYSRRENRVHEFVRQGWLHVHIYTDASSP